MAKGYVLYNPKAGNGVHADRVKALEASLGGELMILDIDRITNYRAFLQGLEAEDYLVIAGGDGTLNRFVNDTAGLAIRNEIFCFPTGTGNDFARDLGKHPGDAPFPITGYLKNLPTVEVRGKTYRFLNGVGYGIDGYCSETGDELRKTPGKKVSYPAIAVRGLLFHYKPTRATVTVDGVTHVYDKVWLAPTMNGRFYGGGMMPAPEQNRCGSGTLSVMVFRDTGILRALRVFPSIFKGTHVRHTDMVEILEGREITVEFDRPTPLQIDGETISGVISYTALASARREAAPRPLAAAGI